MIRADEIRRGKGQIQFSLTVLESRPLRLGNDAAAGSAPSGAAPGLSLSGSQVLIGWVSALSAVGLLLWAFLKLWLFEA